MTYDYDVTRARLQRELEKLRNMDIRWKQHQRRMWLRWEGLDYPAWLAHRYEEHGRDVQIGCPTCDDILAIHFPFADLKKLTSRLPGRPRKVGEYGATGDTER